VIMANRLDEPQAATQVDQYDVRILRTREEIETLGEFWNAWRSGRDADLDFYLFIIDLFPESQRPHVVALYDRGVPTALLAGRLDVGRVTVKVGYVVVPVPKMRILRFVYGGCLGDLSDLVARRLVGSVMESLAAGEADAVMFEHLDTSSPLVTAAKTQPSWWCSDHLIHPEIHRVRDLPDETGFSVASLPKKERYNLRSHAAKLSEDFPNNRIEHFSAPDDVVRLMRDAENVARKSYQRGIGVGFSASPVLQSRLEFEARNGWLQAYVLYADEDPCAFWIGSLRNQVFLSDYLAFDPAYAKYRPGWYLIVKVMEELCGDPRKASAVKVFDFGIGDASYKRKLANRHRNESSVYIFAPSMKALSVNVLRSVVGVTNRSAKELMSKTQLFERIKRMWRMKAAKNQ
jgi:Acetyltransferase (GNAT) domain